MERFNKAHKKGGSFYLVLGLCVVAMGSGIWAAVLTSVGPEVSDLPTGERSIINWENAGGRTLPQQTHPDGEATQRVNIPAANIPDERRTQAAQPSGSTTNPPATKDTKRQPYIGEFALPMGTDILKDYSRGEVVKSKTMGDWRLHEGVDFGGAKGNDVLAVQAGKVKKVYMDALWGTVLELDLGNGMLVRYCGLQEGSTPERGSAVKQSAVIGRLGIIPIEEADTPHLHLEITVNGKIVDPLQAMNRVGEEE